MVAPASVKPLVAPQENLEVTVEQLLPPGTRVRLRSASHVITLQSDTGAVVGPDEKWDGYYIVRLDLPARYDNGVHPPTLLDEMREAVDNLEVLAP